MCHFCGNVGHVSARVDPRPMSELHLTEAEYAEYKSHSASDTLYKNFADNDRPKLRVFGFNDDTKAVFRTCNPEGHDYIEVPWSTMDSVKWIAQRLEDEIRVAMHHWYLATADGVIFKSFGELVCTTAAFRMKGQVVLTLLMPTDLPAFTASHLKQHKWKQTTPGPCTSSDALEKCVAEFHLIDATPSPAWDAYLVQRRAADKSVADDLKEFEGEDRPAVYDKIEKAIANVVKRIDLGDAAPAVHDCIFPLSADLADDGWGNVSSAEILSRIYSPTTPAAIDVSLEYHYRTRYSSVEFYCNIYYRTYPSITDPKLVLSTPQGPRNMNGFRPLLEMGLADVPPGRRWRAIEERTFGLSQVQARTLHRILFGEAADVDADADADARPAGLGGKIDVCEMIALLLASVGISLRVARDDGGAVDAFARADLRWEGLEGSARWMGRHIRAVAQCAPLPRDDEESDKAEDSDEEDDEDEDEDEDGWSDDDERFGGGAEPDCRHQ
ncbi:hypothetical protein B0H16DRAFT_1553337 [Mycena metata]|uniref:Uncharacterized protein n=1 Tax=Mycena metata TaxID=1033252 RepID=A0AAD7IQJ4_9AGAR|nr:hypothetical protein B0H16DRAFT_1553337 [Mycena metata]